MSEEENLIKQIHTCEQDIREEELKKEGKTYFRIGRAIFVIDVLSKDSSLQEAIDTPLGTCAVLSGNAEKLATPEAIKLLQQLFGSTGYLRITIEGDPDAGIGGCVNEVLLTGYRFGLDDVIVDGKLLNTTHGSKAEIMRNFAEFIAFSSWFPKDKKLVRRLKYASTSIMRLAEDFENSSAWEKHKKSKRDSCNKTVTKEKEQ